MSTANDIKDSSHLPLFGLTIPLNDVTKYHYHEDHGENTIERMRIPNALMDWAASPLMFRERHMIDVMGQLTDKPNWKQKIMNEEIVNKWKNEAIERWRNEPVEKQFSEEMFNYCVEEMKDYAKFEEENGFIPAIKAEAIVFKSDTLIPTQLKEELRTAVMPLEQVPDSDKDWHPNSDEKVLDLVHPSLFPLLYGRSRILKPAYGDVLSEGGSSWEGDEGRVSLDDCEQWIGKGGIMPVPREDHTKVNHWGGLRGWGSRFREPEQHFYSSRFQWLPCEVALQDDGSVKITSYINNLQPRKHRGLYQVLEKIIAKVLPMWNTTLTSMEHRMWKETRIQLDDKELPWKDPEGERVPGENEGEDEKEELDADWEKENRTLCPPEPEPYEPDSWCGEDSVTSRYPHLTAIPKTNLRKDFAQHGLQIIVKLANIHLTPDKPAYEGGSWHIEGQMNEYICASALYYYDNSNIEDSHLSFREALSIEAFHDVPYEQSDFEHLERLFGTMDQEGAVQELGAVLTREDRVLTFPNVLQHRVSPFSLTDKTKPGHRKILALFLVDPNLRIPSTAIVPPQQKEWWKDMVHGLDRVSGLPLELREWVTDSVGDFPIGLDEAKRLRLDLMDERRVFVKDHETKLAEEIFHFCEH
ncbi:unnamed protein product [Periconia digitata]|uniref:Uncharacterized protein n=1 Tax=Periconia digitata TaxID=1303443 RepID=A0A9W4U5F4_9PLEO|nr:unnamed protein product [Periconia digitata]